MEPNQTTETSNPPPSTLPPQARNTQKPKQSNKAVMIAAYVAAATMLAGAALLIMWLNNERLYLKEVNEDLQAKVASIEQARSPIEDGKPQLTEEELNEAKSIKQCFERHKYSTSRIGTTMRSISLNPNELVTGEGGSRFYSRWEQLPTVFDKNCEGLELTDLVAGDILNLYTLDKHLIGIQKVR